MIMNIELRCPRCDSNNLARNGKKSNGPQNCLCNACKRQFIIRDEERTYLGTLGCITGFIKTMLVRGCGARGDWVCPAGFCAAFCLAFAC